MTEFLTPNKNNENEENPEQLSPSPVVGEILLRAAQKHLIDFADQSEGVQGVMREGGELSTEQSYKSAIRTMWETATQRPADDQFDADFAEIMRRIETEGAENIIPAERERLAEARVARQAVERGAQPVVAAEETPSQKIGKGVLGRLLRRS